MKSRYLPLLTERRIDETVSFILIMLSWPLFFCCKDVLLFWTIRPYEKYWSFMENICKSHKRIPFLRIPFCIWNQVWAYFSMINVNQLWPIFSCKWRKFYKDLSCNKKGMHTHTSYLLGDTKWKVWTLTFFIIYYYYCLNLNQYKQHCLHLAAVKKCVRGLIKLISNQCDFYLNNNC